MRWDRALFEVLHEAALVSMCVVCHGFCPPLLSYSRPESSKQTRYVLLAGQGWQLSLVLVPPRWIWRCRICCMLFAGLLTLVYYVPVPFSGRDCPTSCGACNGCLNMLLFGGELGCFDWKVAEQRSMVGLVPTALAVLTWSWTSDGHASLLLLSCSWWKSTCYSISWLCTWADREHAGGGLPCT